MAREGVRLVSVLDEADWDRRRARKFSFCRSVGC
jgi:hypothetical protein